MKPHPWTTPLRRGAALLGLCALAGTVQAASVANGHERARMCQTCHGIDGVSKVPEAPNLAGQVEGYLVEQLRAFKAGTRRNEQMSVIAQTLSAQDIQDLAAYYSAIEIKLVKVPLE